MSTKVKTIFQRGQRGRVAYNLSQDLPIPQPEDLIPDVPLRTHIGLPEVGEVEVVRHYSELARRCRGVDDLPYLLGSCTMKYNPRFNETIAALPGFARIHPLQPAETIQGALRLMYELRQMLAEIGGVDEVSLQPAAGAHGELTSLLMVRAYLRSKEEGHRDTVIVPDSSHGTNPATAARAGCRVVQIRSGTDGLIDLGALESALDERTAMVMVTNPNTLGLFETRVQKVCDLVHQAGACAYCDGANLNALLGISRPGDAGFDAIHFNLHKTFSTPHGGGGPGSGPVGYKQFLAPFSPIPQVIRFQDGSFTLDYDRPRSIGKVHAFYGNFGVLVRAYAYLLVLGGAGLRRVSEDAVLNARYLKHLVGGRYEVPYSGDCMHEFVASAAAWEKRGIKARDIAKRLIDYGFYPMTVNFPLIVKEALMIEPTETEDRASMERLAQALLAIADEIETRPELLQEAPHGTPVGRLDEVEAGRRLEVTYEP